MAVPQAAVQRLQRGLVVSCQAPIDSPMHEPIVIAAMAAAAVNQGAAGVRIDTPAHIKAVRLQVSAPIIGLWKQQIPGFEVYITPQFHHAEAIAQAGADIIAIDATSRARPHGETVESLIHQIHHQLNKPVMADVDTLEAAIGAAAAGADLVGTTLYGYTAETQHLAPPGFDLLTELKQLPVPIICEGGIASVQMARQALDLGADAVVVGTAITGVDLQVKAYDAALKAEVVGQTLAASDRCRFVRCDAQNGSYYHYINAKLDDYGMSYPGAEKFFSPAAKRTKRPLEILLLDEQSTIVGGLIASTSCWNWLIIDLLWLDENYRRRGYGKQLMRLAEQEAQQRGCTFSRLNTLSFQAKDFYEKLGYQLVGQMDDYPPGYSQYMLKKVLA